MAGPLSHYFAAEADVLRLRLKAAEAEARKAMDAVETIRQQLAQAERRQRQLEERDD